MDISRNLFGMCSTSGVSDSTSQFDLQSLINKLILFDNFILYSPNLYEIAELVRLIGFENTKSLLESGAMKICCELRLPAQVGQSGFLSPKKEDLPIGQYSVLYGFAGNHKEWISKQLQNVRTSGLSNKQFKQLKLAVVDALDENLLRNYSSDLLDQLNTDLSKNNGIKLFTAKSLLKIKNIAAEPDSFSIRLHQVAYRTFEAETNIGEVFSLDELEVHQVIEQAVLGVAGLIQRIAEMRCHNALSGFLHGELPLYGEKIEDLIKEVDAKNETDLEMEFQRITSLKNLPRFDVSTNQTVDIRRFLEIRQMEDFQVFKNWVRKAEDYDDSEIVSHLNSKLSKAGIFAQSSPGKTIRFATSTLTGVLNPLLGIGLSVFDSFLLDRILPRSGVIAFVDDLYPSIFVKNKSSAIANRRRLG